MAEHTCTKHEPGTPACYSHCGCRCDRCRRAKTIDHKRWRLRQLRGETLMIPSVGTVRRLRALSRVGWTHSAIGREIGMARNAVTRLAGGAHGLVFTSTAAAVAQLYERGWNGPPQPSQRAISHALRQGWTARPIDWDDDTIDDPTAKPCGVLPPATTRTRAERERRIESVRDLLDVGEDPERIAARLGVDVRALTQTLRRHAPELAAHFYAAERRAAA